MAPHSSTLAWKIPWMEEPGGLQSMGLLRVRHDWATSLSLFHFHALEKEMATHSSVLAWRIPGAGEPGGLTSMGSHRVGHDWSDLAAATATYNTPWLPPYSESKPKSSLWPTWPYLIWLSFPSCPCHLLIDPSFYFAPPTLVCSRFFRHARLTSSFGALNWMFLNALNVFVLTPT